MIYYPKPIHQQKPYRKYFINNPTNLEKTEFFQKYIQYSYASLSQNASAKKNYKMSIVSEDKSYFKNKRFSLRLR